MKPLKFLLMLSFCVFASGAHQACYTHTFSEVEHMTMCFRSDSTYIINDFFYGKYYFSDSLLYMTDSSNNEYRSVWYRWKDHGNTLVTIPRIHGIKLEFKYAGTGE